MRKIYLVIFLKVLYSKKRKQNISMPIKSEVKQESDATIKKVEEDRGLTIQVSFSNKIRDLA